MRIFLTGATGYVGSAVLDALVRAGHDVTTLVRDNEKARRVGKRGAHPVIGNLADAESYRSSAEAQDGYVLTAYDRTPGRGPEIDKAVLETIVAAAKRPRTAAAASSAPAKRFVIYTSGMWVLGQSPEPAAEDAPVNSIALTAWRPAHEQFVLGAATDHLRTAVVRPGVVYGGGTGIVADLFKSASNGLVRVVGDGNNHWPLVYDRDLADLYARLVANQDASGIYHANDEGDERVNDLVTVHLAPDQVVAALSLEFRDELTTPQIENAVASIERRICKQHPEVFSIFVKPQSSTTRDQRTQSLAASP